MEKVEKVKKLAELFDLIHYYYENRDQPVDESNDFSSQVADCCQALEIDVAEFKKEFKLEY